jgi:hypothetical protein
MKKYRLNLLSLSFHLAFFEKDVFGSFFANVVEKEHVVSDMSSMMYDFEIE